MQRFRKAKETVPSSPMRHMLSLQDEMNDLSRDFFRGFGRESLLRWSGDGEWLPSADIAETDEAYVMTCDVPGMKQSDLKIAVENNVLALHGERREEKTEKHRGQVLAERAWGAFTRTFPLPSSVDAEKVKAAYKDGVLTVTLPKKPGAKPREVEVKVD